MKFEIYNIPYHFPRQAEKEEDMLFRAVKKILNNNISSTKFMVAYAQKYQEDEEYEHGILHFEYNVDTDEIIFDNDYNEGQRVVFLSLWRLPCGIYDGVSPDDAEIEYFTMRDCKESGWFE